MKSPYTDTLADTMWQCKLYRRKDLEIINAETFPDHIHMYVSIPPKLCI